MEDSALTLYTDMFNELSNKLQEFKKLETLVLCRHSSKGLAGADDIFDRCLKLKELTALFLLSSGDLPGFYHKYDISSIKQRPDIKKFRGHTSILEHGDSLLYLMHKLPRLEKLHIADDCYDILKCFYINHDAVYESNQITTAEIMVKFFNYLSRIPSVVVHCNLMGMDLDVLVEFLTKRKSKFEQTITIQYYDFKTDFSIDNYNNVCLSYPRHKCTETMLHSSFIEKAGHSITRLSISGVICVQAILHEIAKESPVTNDMVNGAWLIHILEHCPYLVDLEISEPGAINLGNNNKKNFPSIRKLTLHGIDDAILTDLALLFPSLTNLYILSRPETRKTVETFELTTFDMPDISFEMLAWEYVHFGWGYSHLCEIYIKVKTPLQVFFFGTDSGNKDNVKVITEDEFIDTSTNDREDQLALVINCKCISKLHIMRGNIDKVYHLNVGFLA